MLRADHHHRFRPRRSVHFLREIDQYAFSLRAVQIRRADRRIRADRGHRALIRFESAFDMKRLPWARLLVFADADGIFSRPAESRFACRAGIGAANIAFHELHEAADRRIRAPSFAQRIGTAVDV